MASNLREKRRNQIIYTSIGSVLAILVLFLILYFTFKNMVGSEENNMQLGEQNNYSQENTEEASQSIGNSVEDSQNSEQTGNFVKVQVNENLENSENLAQENLIDENGVEIADNSDNGQVLAATNENENVNQNDNQATQNNPIEEVVQDPTFVMPVEGEITKHYGKEKLIYSDTLKEWTTHLGIDIKADKTTIVKASSDGCVKSIKNDPRYGLTIVIEHQNGFSTVYSNLLTSEFVVVGENVKSGQTIGTVGSTATFEILDDPHLHFEILKDGNCVDPEMYIK